MGLQVAAVLGYTVTAAINMPELTLDHCGPLVKNLPVLALIVLLWCAVPAPRRLGRTVRLNSALDVAGRREAV
jgi:hypothetical protein